MLLSLDLWGKRKMCHNFRQKFTMTFVCFSAQWAAKQLKQLEKKLYTTVCGQHQKQTNQIPHAVHASHSC